jgi:hypothetical protein
MPSTARERNPVSTSRHVSSRPNGLTTPQTPPVLAVPRQLLQHSTSACHGPMVGEKSLLPCLSSV